MEFPSLISSTASALAGRKRGKPKFFLRMVAVAEPTLKSEAWEIWREAHALHRIWRSTKV